jgi:predicted metal-dependent peptidase
MREVSTFRKRQTQIDVEGRGGTEFQSLFDYIKDKRWYDGLIIFTDGYASEPKVEFRMRTKVLWVCQSESDYKRHVDWMKKTGKVCWIEF